MKTIYSQLAFMGLMIGLTACSDIDIPGAPNEGLATVEELQIAVEGRNVTLTWSPVAGAAGYKVLCNDSEIANLEASVTSYTIRCAYDTKLTYTVKVVTANGLVSLGKSVHTYVEAPADPVTGAGHVGYLLTTATYQELPDDDEVAAAQWFKDVYVDGDKGAFFQPAEIATIDVKKYTTLWINIDRVGLEHGYQNLPFDGATIAALHKYVCDGGNLYLSKHATQLVAAIARIEDRLAPGIFSSGEGGTGDDIWCVNNVIGSGQAVKYDHRDHPLFTNLEGEDPNGYGFYNFPLEGPGMREDHNCMWDLNAYGFSGEPNVVINWQNETSSVVLATWGHVQDYCCAGIVDFQPAGEFKGEIIANGLSAYEFAQKDGNKYQSNIERLTRNTLDFLKEGGSSNIKAKAAYVLTAATPADLADDDEVAAAEWFKQQYVDKGLGIFIQPEEIATLDVTNYAMLWIHIDRVGLGLGWENLPQSLIDNIGAIHNYLRDGGNIYFSKHATQLVAGIARIEDRLAPGIFSSGEGGTGDDIWCVNNVIGSGQAIKYDHRSHAIFADLDGEDPNGYGFYNFPLEGPGMREDHNCMWDLNSYGFEGDPNVVANWEAATQSTVLATWGHVQDYCCAGIIEFGANSEFKGVAIANGLSAYEFNQAGGNVYQKNVNRLTQNIINYLR